MDVEVLEPRTIDEAAALRAEHGDDAKLLAGGTALVLMLRNRLVAPRYLISLNTVEGWREVAYEPGRGRLCHLANGHTREALLHPMFQRLLRNAIAWCVRQEADAGPGAR